VQSASHSREHAQSLDEGHCEEEHAGDERRDRHRDPHLLRAPLGAVHELAVDLAPHRWASSEMSLPRSPASRLRASTLTRRFSASTSARPAHSRSASRSLIPWRTRAHTRRRSAPQTPCPRRASLARAPPSEYPTDSSMPSCSATTGSSRTRRRCQDRGPSQPLLDDEESERWRTQEEEQADDQRQIGQETRRRYEPERAECPTELTHAELGDREGRVDALESRGGLLRQAEYPGDACTQVLGERREGCARLNQRSSPSSTAVPAHDRVRQVRLVERRAAPVSGHRRPRTSSGPGLPRRRSGWDSQQPLGTLC
jgi:hypothetical protein